MVKSTSGLGREDDEVWKVNYHSGPVRHWVLWNIIMFPYHQLDLLGLQKQIDIAYHVRGEVSMRP